MEHWLTYNQASLNWYTNIQKQARITNSHQPVPSNGHQLCQLRTCLTFILSQSYRLRWKQSREGQLHLLTVCLILVLNKKYKYKCKCKYNTNTNNTNTYKVTPDWETISLEEVKIGPILGPWPQVEGQASIMVVQRCFAGVSMTPIYKYHSVVVCLPHVQQPGWLSLRFLQSSKKNQIQAKHATSLSVTHSCDNSCDKNCDRCHKMYSLWLVIQGLAQVTPAGDNPNMKSQCHQTKPTQACRSITAYGHYFLVLCSAAREIEVTRNIVPTCWTWCAIACCTWCTLPHPTIRHMVWPWIQPPWFSCCGHSSIRFQTQDTLWKIATSGFSAGVIARLLPDECARARRALEGHSCHWEGSVLCLHLLLEVAACCSLHSNSKLSITRVIYVIQHFNEQCASNITQ